MAARVTAWSSWAEWSEVYRNLSSPDPAARAAGVQRVQTWRSRAKLPVAVDVTASFVEVMLNDPQLNTSSAAPRSDHELQLLYSMCVVRLVNGIVDAAQRANAKSISVLAQELEWPQWFVDLRHEATHQRLPTVHALRLAAKEAVFLLFERFWRPQQEQLERRGRGPVARLGRTVASAPPLRDRRFVDRRLRALVALTSRRRTNEEASSPTAASGAAASAAVELASLATDEARLLTRLFATTLAGLPHADGREARAVHLVCAASSDNFAVRLAREVVARAVGLPRPSFLEPAPDVSPGLRNICDGASRVDDQLPEAEEDVEGAEAATMRMLRWLKALLSCGALPEEAACDADPEARHTRFYVALSELAPWLRLAILRHMAAAPPAVAATLAARASVVWQVLAAYGVDRGAQHFASLCAITATAAAEQPSTSKEEGGGADTQAVPSLPKLDVIEAFIEGRRKRRRVSPAVGSGHGSAEVVVVTEPWTALGTTFDPNSLDIRCSLDGVATRGSDATAAAMEEVASLWRAWAVMGTSKAEVQGQRSSVAAVATRADLVIDVVRADVLGQPKAAEGGGIAAVGAESPDIEDVPDDADTAEPEDNKAAPDGEAAFRARAGALFARGPLPLAGAA